MPDTRLQRKYQVRIVVFLAGVIVGLLVLSVVSKSIHTLRRLELVESDRDKWQRTSEVITALDLKSGDVAADVGAGSGYFTLRMSRAIGANGRIVAVDIRRLPLAFLWTRAILNGQLNVRTRVGEPDDPHLPVHTFHAILLANTFHEFDHPNLMIERFWNALRPGGRLVVLDRSSTSTAPDEEGNRHALPPDSVEVQLRLRGFKVLNRQDQFIARPGEQWWLLTCTKPE